MSLLCKLYNPYGARVSKPFRVNEPFYQKIAKFSSIKKEPHWLRCQQNTIIQKTTNIFH